MPTVVDPAHADLELLTIEDVSALLKISRRGVTNLVNRNAFPRPFKLGRSTRWHAQKVREWLAGEQG